MSASVPPSRSVRASVALLLGATAQLACSGDRAGGVLDPAQARGAITLRFSAAPTGRVERGDSVQVMALRGADTLPVAQIVVSPAAAAVVGPGAWLHLRAAGPLALEVAVRDTGSTSTTARSATLDVAEPPVLVFERLLDGNRDIWRVALDGAALAPLTTDPGDDQHPTAAGQTVIFTSYRSGHAQLYRVALDGTGEQRLTATADNLVEPALSSDGRRIALIRDTAGLRRLWWSTADGTKLTPAIAATGWPGAIDGTPAWSPDGARLAFTSTRTGAAGVFLAAATGGSADAAPAAGAAPDAAAATVEPAWSPDGRQLVVTSTRTGPSELFAVDLASGSATQLTTAGGTVGQPVWLRDGRVVFTSFTRTGARLRWLDPRAPALVHDIPTGDGTAAHAAAVR